MFSETGEQGGTPSVTFYGVRGSTPCSSDALRRYGGNTSCAVIEADDHPPIILDMGTGLREYGAVHGPKNPIDCVLLVTHLHWDHVQGLPFFGPVHNPQSKVTIYGPPHGDKSLAEAFDGLMKPPYFPICCADLPDGVQFMTMWDEVAAIGDAKVTARSVPHVGATNGYRVEIQGRTIVYISDHQEPLDDQTRVTPEVLELCADADLLIHDAQFTPEELAQRPDWGHCTPRFALEVAAQAGVETLCLFHHDPWHDDGMVDQLLAETREVAAELGVPNVIAAREGMTVA